MKRVTQFARLFTRDPSLLARIDDRDFFKFSNVLTQIAEEYPSDFLDTKNLNSQEFMLGLSDLLERQRKDLYIGEYHEQWDSEHINFYYHRMDYVGPRLQKDNQWILGTVNDWLPTFDIRERFCQFSDGKDLQLTALLPPETIHAIQTHFQETPFFKGSLTFTEPSYKQQQYESNLDSFAWLCFNYNVTATDLKPFLDPSSYHESPFGRFYHGPDPQTKAQKFLWNTMNAKSGDKWQQMLEGLKERAPYLFQDQEEKQPFYGDLNKLQALEAFAKVFVKEPLTYKFKQDLNRMEYIPSPTFSKVSDLLADYGFLHPSTIEGISQAEKLLGAENISMRFNPNKNLVLEKSTTHDIVETAWRQDTVSDILMDANQLLEHAGYDSRFYTLGEREYVTVLMPEEADHIQELFSRFPNLAEDISLTKPGEKALPTLGDALDALDSEEQMNL